MDFVAAVAVEAKPSAGPLPVLLVRAYDLDQPFIAAERRGRLRVQIDQHAVMSEPGVVESDDDRSLGRQRIALQAMRNEPDSLVCPEQLVEAPSSVLVGR